MLGSPSQGMRPVELQIFSTGTASLYPSLRSSFYRSNHSNGVSEYCGTPRTPKKKSQIEGVRGVPQWLECCEILNIVKIPNKFSIEKSLKWLEWNNGICGFPIFAPSHMLAVERSLSRNKRVGTPKLETRPLQPLFI